MNVRTPPTDETLVDLASEPVFLLGPVEVTPSLLALRRGERSVSLEPRVMQLLTVLARRPGLVVSRDELVATCWAGRFISEDAIQRCVAKLRRHALEDADDAFAVETVPRVGYRLVVREGALAVRGAAVTAGRSHRMLAIGAALALALAALGAVAWWAKPFGSAHVATVQMAGFKAIGGDVPADLPVKMFADARDAFGDDNELVIKDRGADFVLRGDVRRVENRYRYSVQLQDHRDGTLVWSSSREWPVTASRQPHEIAVTMTQTLRCGLKGAGEYPRRLPDHTLGLFLQFCDHSGNMEHDVALARRMVAETPDFGRGWSGLAFRTMMMTGNPALTPGDKQALVTEAHRAAAMALRLDPRNAQIYETQSYLLPEGDRIGQERLLRRAAASHLTDCGCELLSYAAFMQATGRLSQANALYRRALEYQPFGLEPALRLAGSYDQIGQATLADQVFAKSAQIYGDNRQFRMAHARYAARAGQWAEEVQWVTTYSSPAVRPVFLAAFAALQSGDPARIRAARPGIEERLRSGFDPGLLDLLLAMDDRDVVFSASQTQVSQHPGYTLFLFSPRFAALSHDPRYEKLMEAAGLMSYWRATRTRPDLCAVPDAPAFCQRL